MRTPHTSTPAAPGRLAARLLLALALCACGGGDDADRPADAAAPAARSDARAAAQEACSPPPTVDPRFLTGSWDALENEIRRKGGLFPDTPLNTSTRSVKLCDSCAVVSLILHADTATHGTTPEHLLTRELRVMGTLVLGEDFKGGTHGWGPIAKGQTIFAFASDTFGPATMAYRDTVGNVATAPPGSWMFLYCNHDPIPAGDTLAQWRFRGPAPPRNANPAAGARGRGDDEEDDEGGSYGWMACASGCCQFYTPPPNDNGGEDDDDDRRGGRGGAQRLMEPDTTRPYWCNRAH
jgi:hypothetical protein